MHPIELTRISKHYKLGSNHDSLRDAIPSLVKRLIGRNDHASGKPDGFWALKDVTFHVAKGETLGLIGPNGAGKSTILKLLSRITRQTKGTLRVRGRLAALIELGGGFHGDLSGEENIYLQGTMLGLSHKQIGRLYPSIAEFSELGEFLAMPVKKYSSGMVVRLGFAIAAHIDPDVLLLDEVLAVGDLSFQQKSFERILELKRRGTTMIFISHDLNAVQKLCDRVVLLDKGSIADEGRPGDVIQRYRNRVSKSSNGASPLFRSSGAFTIRSVRALNAHGEDAETIEVGQPLRVELAYTASRPIKRPDVQIWIDRVDGLQCHVATTHESRHAEDLPAGEGTITLEYESFTLLPHSYMISVDVCEDAVIVPMASAHSCRSFQVTSNSSEQGAVHLTHRWQITPSKP